MLVELAVDTQDDPSSIADVARALAGLASRAGAEILAVRREGFTPRLKADKSPVCTADERAEAVLIAGVTELFPGLPIVAEEDVAKHGAPETPTGAFVLIDALDGTRNFVKGGDEFTVNVAVVGTDGAPSTGVVYAPATGELFLAHHGAAWFLLVTAGAEPDFALAQALHTRAYPNDGLHALRSCGFHTDSAQSYLDDLGVAQMAAQGSSLKFCTIARGEADVYARFGATSEWDTAAGHAVLAAAGGAVTTPEGTPFTYAKEGFKNGPFVAWGASVLVESD